MNIELTDEKCIFVELTGDDLESFGITYEQFEFRDEKIRSILKNILREAKSQTNTEICFNSNIRIELLPGIPDGCVIIFTPLSVPDKTFRIFEADNFDDILDCAKALYTQNKKIKSSLYRDNDCFRLVVHHSNENAITVLCEFLTELDCDELEESRTAEYMTCLIDENALEILCGK